MPAEALPAFEPATVQGTTTKPSPTKQYEAMSVGNDADSAEVRFVVSDRDSWTAEREGNVFEDVQEFFSYAPAMKADWTGRAESEIRDFPAPEWDY